MQISSPFIAEILTVAMLVILNGRVFFTRHTRHDALAILAPFCFAIVIFEMFAWGVRITNIALFFLCFFTAIFNYRSIVRFSQNLFVDSYSIKFFVASILLLILSILFLLANFFFRPVNIFAKRYNVQTKREYYSCPVSDLPFSQEQFKNATKIYDKRNFALYTFFCENKSLQKDTIVLFVPDIQAEVFNYTPYLVLLARSGYTVLAADLHCGFEDWKNLKFLRRFLTIFDSIKNANYGKRAADTRAHDFSKIYEASYNALACIAKNDYSEKGIFIVCDSSSFLNVEKLDAIFEKYFSPPDARAFPQFLDLASIDEYKTKGFGFVCQTSPLFAKIFLHMQRDKTLFSPSYCVMQTRKKIGEQ